MEGSWSAVSLLSIPLTLDYKYNIDWRTPGVNFKTELPQYLILRIFSFFFFFSASPSNFWRRFIDDIFTMAF